MRTTSLGKHIAFPLTKSHWSPCASKQRDTEISPTERKRSALLSRTNSTACKDWQISDIHFTSAPRGNDKDKDHGLFPLLEETWIKTLSNIGRKYFIRRPAVNEHQPVWHPPPLRAIQPLFNDEKSPTGERRLSQDTDKTSTYKLTLNFISSIVFTCLLTGWAI